MSPSEIKSSLCDNKNKLNNRSHNSNVIVENVIQSKPCRSRSTSVETTFEYVKKNAPSSNKYRFETLNNLIVEELVDVSDEIYNVAKWQIIDILKEASIKHRRSHTQNMDENRLNNAVADPRNVLLSPSTSSVLVVNSPPTSTPRTKNSSCQQSTISKSKNTEEIDCFSLMRGKTQEMDENRSTRPVDRLRNVSSSPSASSVLVVNSASTLPSRTIYSTCQHIISPKNCTRKYIEIIDLNDAG